MSSYWLQTLSPLIGDSVYVSWKDKSRESGEYVLLGVTSDNDVLLESNRRSFWYKIKEVEIKVD